MIDSMRKEKFQIRPEVSIVTAVYNGASLIEETVLSVINCMISFPRWEYIIINDGSTDETLQKILKFTEAQNVRIVSQVNQGEANSVNLGIKLAQGDFILVVSHDDPMLSSDLIPIAVKLLKKHSDVVCVYPDWQIIDKRGQVLKIKVVEEYSERELIGRFNCLPGPGAVFRRDEALKIGGRRKWKFVSDYDFWLRLSRLGEFKRIPGVHAQWRSHPDSTTVSMKSFDMAKERISLMDDFTSNNRISPKLRRMALSSAYYYAARLGVFSSKIPARRWMAISFLRSRAWPKVANPLVVLFVLTLPVSKIFLKAAIPFSRRLREVF